jgi:adenylosuccinate lyase
MAYLFSAEKKFRTWRQLWIVLAEAERELGIDISAAQIAELKRHADDINFERAEALEEKTRHDVMAHLHAFAEQCPKAKPIIHLGATSCYVTDNADLIILREALDLLTVTLANVIDRLAVFAEQHKGLPTLGHTHFQPAQPTTVGKRACLWIQDFVMDLGELELRRGQLRALGSKGTTGTQASFLELFHGNHAKCERLDQLVARKIGFEKTYDVTGQTYPRKVDAMVLSALSGIAQSAHKFANDLRLLAQLKEIEEPFEEGQVGSSAMAYKRNPMRAERITGLSRLLMCNALNPALTAAEQWLERTLDDSSNRRVAIAEAFLAADGILDICLDVASGLVVYPEMIRANLEREMPFMATEPILMAAVQAGGDRQKLHERIRQHSMAAGRRVKLEGGENDLLERIAADKAFAAIRDRIPELADPARFVGRAPQQVQAFLRKVVAPIRRRYQSSLGSKSKLRV